MTPQEFKRYRKSLRQDADDIADVKGQDYAGLTDVCLNFKEAARSTGMTKYQVWLVYCDKHLSAIRNSIRLNPQHPEAASEPLRNRIIDAVNYLQLLGAMLDEDQPLSHPVRRLTFEEKIGPLPRANNQENDPNNQEDPDSDPVHSEQAE